jgi:hypothetical protein
MTSVASDRFSGILWADGVVYERSSLQRVRQKEELMKTKIRVIISALTVCALCTGIAWAGGAGQYSGFLEDYPAFEPDKDRKGAMTYRKPGSDLKPYTKILIDPIEIWVAPDSKYKGIKPDEMKALSDGWGFV